MTHHPSKTVGILMFLLVGACIASAASKPGCAECGMIVDEQSRFSARIVGNASTTHFCDIGDLLIYLRDKKHSAADARVKDYLTGEWVDASTAIYVRDTKRFSTPMGWSVAAFRDRDKAGTYGTPMDYAAMSAELK